MICSLLRRKFLAHFFLMNISYYEFFTNYGSYIYCIYIDISYIVHSIITTTMRFTNLLLDSDQEAHSGESSGHESNVSDGK